MGIELKVTCNQGFTGLAFGDTVRIDELGELLPPPAWNALRTDSPGRGTAVIGGQRIRFENTFVDGAAPGRLELRGRILPWAQAGADGHPAKGIPAVEEMCFNGGGSGDHVVGTWIAEGGG